ncbi:hypothetical protein GcM3_212046 [Golovinomyces cichoracearum]|uniref:Uncharacterized protein n=1 Tax=Golovinomyces cichoracearum TaxID=62708 RepID=A0A420H9F3_9PEZI|nr:hypothetical protein GcM3_212046 [Golovinomyces cichoracearum]
MTEPRGSDKVGDSKRSRTIESLNKYEESTRSKKKIKSVHRKDNDEEIKCNTECEEKHSQDLEKEPTRSKMTNEIKKEYASSGRVAFCSVPKSIRKGRASAIKCMRRHIDSLKVKGIEAMDSSAGSFVAGIKTIEASSFQWKEKMVNPVALAFGGSSSKPLKIWIISASILTTAEEIVQGVKEHLTRSDPVLNLKFQVRGVRSGNYLSGKWAVKFFGSLPVKFEKRLTVKSHKFLITQEPCMVCRFCGNAGHTIFECHSENERSLDSKIWDGIIGNSEVIEDEEFYLRMMDISKTEIEIHNVQKVIEKQALFNKLKIKGIWMDGDIAPQKKENSHSGVPMNNFQQVEFTEYTSIEKPIENVISGK